MTLRAQITSDVAAVFLETDDFAETIVHYPAGKVQDAESITAVVDYDTLEATPDEGGKIRQRALLELAISVTVTIERGLQSSSTFEIDDELWVAQDIVGKDHAMQTVEIWKVDQKHTRRANS
jgi:hypothetical protein